jgi:hypothetical protein
MEKSSSSFSFSQCDTSQNYSTVSQWGYSIHIDTIMIQKNSITTWTLQVPFNNFSHVLPVPTPSLRLCNHQFFHIAISMMLKKWNPTVCNLLGVLKTELHLGLCICTVHVYVLAVLF